MKKNPQYWLSRFRQTLSLAARLAVVGVVLLGALLVVACDASPTVAVSARIVDRYCHPIPRQGLLIVEHLPSLAPLAGRSQRVREVTSDAQGYVDFSVSASTSRIDVYVPRGGKELTEMQRIWHLSQSHWGISYPDGMPMSIDAYAPLRRSRRENPLYLYKMDDVASASQTSYQHNLISMPFGERIRPYMPSAMSQSFEIGGLVLHWYLDNEKPYLEVIGVKQGAVREMRDADDLRAPFPTDGFAKRALYRLEAGRFRRSFFVKGEHADKLAWVSIELLFDAEQSLAYATIYSYARVVHQAGAANFSPLQKSASEGVLLPIETCGGVLSRAPGGYYASLNAGFHAYLRGRPSQSNPHAQLIQTAANPDTPMAWIREHITPIADPADGANRTGRSIHGAMADLAIAALDNNGDADQRLSYLFDVAQANGWRRVLQRIAKDWRSPAPLLHRAFDALGASGIGAIARNPRADDGLLNRLLDYLQDESAENLNYHLPAIAAHPNASPETLERVFALSSGGFGADRPRRPPAQGVISSLLLNPSITEKPLERLVQTIARLPDAEADYYLLALQHPALDEALRSAIRTTLKARLAQGELGGDIAAKQSLQALLARPNAAHPSTNTSVRQSPRRNRSSARQMAANPETAPDVLRDLFEQSEDGEILRHLAANPASPDDVLDRLLDGEYVLTTNLEAERWFPRSLFCNPSVEPASKRYLPYQDPAACRDIRRH